jgi:hypothetical protein
LTEKKVKRKKTINEVNQKKRKQQDVQVFKRFFFENSFLKKKKIEIIEHLLAIFF